MSKPDPYSRVEYRRLIAWPRRIVREWPLLEKVLSTAPVRRILDLGCGTGEHSRFLADQGFEVVGVDASESMLAKAKDQPLPGNLRFVAGDISRLDELDDLGSDDFGGAICLGNTLPHLQTREALEGLVRGLRRRLAPTAPVLFQLLNYERIFERQESHLPVNFRPGDGDNRLVFLRLMEPREDGSVLFFPTTLELQPDREPPVTVKSSRRVELYGWRWSELEPILATAFDQREVYGAFDASGGSPWTASDSRDLIVVAR